MSRTVTFFISIMPGRRWMLSLALYHLGLIEQKDLLQHGWFFKHGTYPAVRVDGNGAELVRFNR